MCDARFFLVGLQGEFESDHSWECKGYEKKKMKNKNFEKGYYFPRGQNIQKPETEISACWIVRMINLCYDPQQIDLGLPRNVSGVATQGFAFGGWVTAFLVKYSVDGVTWKAVKDEKGNPKVRSSQMYNGKARNCSGALGTARKLSTNVCQTMELMIISRNYCAMHIELEKWGCYDCEWLQRHVQQVQVFVIEE